MLQSATQETIAQAQINANQVLQQMQNQQAILMSALSNPWLQRLVGMAPQQGQSGSSSGQVPNWVSGSGASGVQQGVMNAQTGASGAAGGGGVPGGLPTFKQVTSASPFDLAAWRTNLEATQGPGGSASAFDALRSSWAGQGITDAPASSQLAWDTSTPGSQAAQGMVGEIFGNTLGQQAQTKGTQWAKAAQPAVSAIT
jgi:hypothetical protein